MLSSPRNVEMDMKDKKSYYINMHFVPSVFGAKTSKTSFLQELAETIDDHDILHA